MEDEHAALPARGAGRGTARVRVLRILDRRELAEQVDERCTTDRYDSARCDVSSRLASRSTAAAIVAVVLLRRRRSAGQGFVRRDTTEGRLAPGRGSPQGASCRRSRRRACPTAGPISRDAGAAARAATIIEETEIRRRRRRRRGRAGCPIPPDGKIPYQPWALAERNKHRAGLARGWPGETGERLYIDPQTFCLKSVPRYAQRGFELVQTPGYVVQMLNWGHYHRRIPLDDRPRPGRARSSGWAFPAAAGTATRWSSSRPTSTARCGSTASGTSYSRTRGSRSASGSSRPNTIDYEVTIDDPATFTQPWTLKLPTRGAPGPAAAAAAARTTITIRTPVESWEHACHEGNWNHIEGAEELGFKWFRGATPPTALM